MQSLLKAMNRDLQGLWIARLARDPLLVSGLLLPVWCVGARTQFSKTRCTIPTFVNVACGTCPIAAIWLPRAANFSFVFSLVSPASFVGSEQD